MVKYKNRRICWLHIQVHTVVVPVVPTVWKMCFALFGDVVLSVRSSLAIILLRMMELVAFLHLYFCCHVGVCILAVQSYR